MDENHIEKEPKRGPGRPRKYQTNKERIKAFRRRKDQDTRRFDYYVTYSAHHRIETLSKHWECSKSDVINRLVLEASDSYNDILFPVTE